MGRDKPLTYKDAGVDIEAGYQLVDRIKGHVASTARSGALGALGGFGGLFELPVDRYRQPVLVAGTDGVGTKLRLAIEYDRHDSIGIDLVAMCANDVVVQGAEPLFFLDYYASGKLRVDRAAQVIAGIAAGCRTAGMALIGGETAEMPGIYHGEDYDLAGFCVGVVEKDQLIDGRAIRAGSTLLGLPASGPHSNGYSLIRKLLERDPPDAEVLEALLAPTCIYVQPLLQLMTHVTVLGAAHITGGGLVENVPRMLPAGLAAHINLSSWRRAAVFDWLQATAGLAMEPFANTFNCGLGMVVALQPEAVETGLSVLAEADCEAVVIGDVRPAGTDPIVLHP
jgi:phosphoribosylformylglycinamidine cyclo-ligase